MVAGHEPSIAWHRILDTVSEDEVAAAVDLPGADEVRDDAVEGNLSEAYDNAQLRERCDLFVEEGCAAGNLLRERFISGRRASHYGGDPRIFEGHAVFAVGG